MELNILRLDVDRSHRVFSTNNLSLNQCSNNNQIRLYYDGEYNFIQMSFRKPDGWLSDKVTLIFDVDEEGYKYAYYDISEEFTSFIMGGRNAILQANLYFNIRVSATEYQTATTGNIRINVNYVDDALVNTNFSQAYMNNINAQIGALQNDFNRFKTGDILVGKAISDQYGNPIDVHYETKSDAIEKFNTLDEKKLDRSEVSDQTNRLNVVESNITSANNRVNTLETEVNDTISAVSNNAAEITKLKEDSVKLTTFEDLKDDLESIQENLQSQIDDLSSASNVKEMVGTYSDLTKYASQNAATLEVGDRIQVLSDAFYGNVPTIYRWNGTEFEFVGKYAAASYTKAEIDSQHNAIKNTIPNRVSLNNGEIKLYKGSSVLSNENVKLKTVNGESIWGDGNIIIPIDSEFSTTSKNPIENRVLTAAILTKADQSSLESLRILINGKADTLALNEKQDLLYEGANIKIHKENGKTYISTTSAISLKKVDVLPRPGTSNIIYLFKPEGESGYSEYLWDEDIQDYEPFGEAGIHLENYYTKTQIEEFLSKKVDLETLQLLDDRVTSNTAAIATKADRATTDSAIIGLTASVSNLNSAVVTKAEKSEITKIETEYARKDSVPETYQEKLVNTLNIKSINGVSLLGSGDLALADTTITDLGLYLKKVDAQAMFDAKANKTDLFDKDYNKLKNLPDLGVYALTSDLNSTKNAVLAEISKKQDNLVSGTHIKTINGESILGSGDLEVITDLTGYATEDYVNQKVLEVDVSDQLSSYATQVWVGQQGYMKTIDAATTFATKGELPTIPTKISAFTNDSNYLTLTSLPKNISHFTNDRGYLLPADIVGKQDNLVSGTNIKTINGNSILGSGNLTLITDVSHLETKTDASSKLNEAKTYSDTNRRELQTNISSNTSLISSLRTDLSNEISNRTKGDADTLASAKAYTDNTIRDLTEDTEGALEAIKEIKDQIGGEGVNILSSINQNKTDISNIRSDLTTEISNRNTAETNLQNKITENTEDIESLQTQLNTEITNRTNGDTTLTNKISTLESKVNTTVERIDDDLIDLNNAITKETNARIAEDTNIYNIIDSFTAASNTKITNIETSVDSLSLSLASSQEDINNHKVAADTRFNTVENSISKKVLFKNWVIT